MDRSDIHVQVPREFLEKLHADVREANRKQQIAEMEANENWERAEQLEDELEQLKSQNRALTPEQHAHIGAGGGDDDPDPRIEYWRMEHQKLNDLLNDIENADCQHIDRHGWVCACCAHIPQIIKNHKDNW